MKILRTDWFRQWLCRLRDRDAEVRITVRFR